MTAPPDPARLPVLSEDAVLRVLRSLLPAELRAGGRRLEPLEGVHWTQAQSLREDGLALDSLELLACAASVNRMFQLHETGLEDYLLGEMRLEGWVRVVRACLAEGVSGATFTTSGSTGAPSACGHKAADLAAEIAFWCERFGDRRRIVPLVPAHHIYGFLFTVLLPEALDVPVLDARGLGPGALARELRGTDLVIGFPAGLSALLRSLPSLPAGIRVTSSTAPLPEGTHLALRAHGAERVIEIYGSSETGGIGWRDRPGAAFRLLPRWARGQAGERASVVERASGTEMPLPDRVEWDGGDALLPQGRKDRSVQVGGVNVQPEHVARRIASHPLVSSCVVRLDTGLAEPRLKAFVVPREGQDPGAVVAPLEAWCREHLPTPERPVRIDAGAALPVNEMGKLADWGA